MTKKERVPDYLKHIFEAIERIEKYTKDMNKATFLDSELVQDAVVRNIEVIGEAAKNVLIADEDFAKKHSNVPWQLMYTMRNRLSHGYSQVDFEIVWKTVKNDLPVVSEQVKSLGGEQAVTLLSQVETTASEQRALLENTSVEQVMTATLKPYVEAKHAQVERLEGRMQAAIEQQEAKVQRIDNSPPKHKWYASKKTKSASEAAWRKQCNHAQGRLYQLQSRARRVEQIKDTSDSRRPNIEELATRKLRRDHPELASSWDAMRHAVRQKEQQARQERERQQKQQKQQGQKAEQSQGLGLSLGRWH